MYLGRRKAAPIWKKHYEKARGKARCLVQILVQSAAVGRLAGSKSIICMTNFTNVESSMAFSKTYLGSNLFSVSPFR
jgi:hypothetical protein